MYEHSNNNIELTVCLSMCQRAAGPIGLLLNKDLDGVPQKYDWEYRGAIWMLTYLTGSVRPDIAMAVHQCARFSTNPMRLHEQAVMRIGRYLLSTREKGMIYKPDSTKGIEVY